jgi:hypothetical protein
MRRETMRIPCVKPCVSFAHSMRILCVSLTHGMRYIRDGMDAGNCQDSHSADIIFPVLLKTRPHLSDIAGIVSLSRAS